MLVESADLAEGVWPLAASADENELGPVSGVEEGCVRGALYSGLVSVLIFIERAAFQNSVGENVVCPLLFPIVPGSSSAVTSI